MGEAISMLRQRAELERTDLEQIAETVIGQQTRLGYRDHVASDVIDVREKARVARR